MYHLGWQTTKEKGHRSGEHESTAKHIHGHDEDGKMAMKDRHPVPEMTGGEGDARIPERKGVIRKEEKKREGRGGGSTGGGGRGGRRGRERRMEDWGERERQQPDSFKTTALRNPRQ